MIPTHSALVSGGLVPCLEGVENTGSRTDRLFP
jgi:hypothetical protein